MLWFLGIHCGHMRFDSLVFIVSTCVLIPWYSLLAHVLRFLGFHCGHIYNNSFVFTVGTRVMIPWYSL